MADAEKEKQEKLAAARKRVEALKKQKGKKAGERTDKKKDEFKSSDKETKIPEGKYDPAGSPADAAPEDNILNVEESESKVGADDDLKTNDDAIETEANDTKPASNQDQTPSTPRASHGRQSSLSIQSKMRSSSFRHASGSGPNIPTSPIVATGLAPLSPKSDSMSEIYRKQAARLEELERENKRLTKDLDTSENRWRKAEEELEELRSNSAQIAELKTRAERSEGKAEEVEKLNLELQSLRRQNSHLQSVSSKSRHSPASPSISSASIISPTNHSAQLASKTAAIESMEMEISNLRAQLTRTDTSRASQGEQVSALEEKVNRAERAAGAAQRELLDARKNLERASEKALKAGTENTSSQARIKELERDFEAASIKAEEAIKRAENSEKKLTALTNLHKESDTRRRDGERDITEMKKRIISLENETSRQKTEAEAARKRVAGSTHTADDGLDELEDEQRLKLETRIRELEDDLFEARRGMWRDKRREMQGEMVIDGEDATLSPLGDFDEVDLSGGSVRKNSARANISSSVAKKGGFVDVLSSGLQAITGGPIPSAPAGQRRHGRNESLALLDDDDDEFDENAFRVAQEAEALKRVERVKEVKRGLKDWSGYRLDIVDLRMGGGGGIGEIFDI